MYVLVTYASEHGGTRKVAHVIATMLRFQRVRLSIQPIEQVEDISEYDAVIVGSAAHDSQWLPSAEKFIAHHIDELAEKEVWVFSTGDMNHPIPDRLSGAMQIIQPQDIAVFGNPHNAEQLDRTLVKNFRKWDDISFWAGEIVQYLKGRILAVRNKSSQI